MIQAAFTISSSDNMIIVFRHGHWYRYDFFKEKVIKKFPKSHLFAEIPENIQGTLEGRLKRQDKIYFFHNEEYYRYDQFKTKIDRGYPKSIKSVWGVDADKISCALNTEGVKAYLFHGEEYTRFDFSTNKKDAGYPKKIRDHWKGVPTDPDAAFRGLGARATKVYFFKGQQYYRYDMKKRRVDSGYPKPIHPLFGNLVERKEMVSKVTFPMLTKINRTRVDSNFGMKDRLRFYGEYSKVSGKIVLPYVTGTIVSVCLHSDKSIICLINNATKGFQIVKINPQGERDTSFATNGIYTFVFSRENEIRKLTPVAIDVSVDGTIVVGMNIVHDIRIVRDKNLNSYAFQKVNQRGRPIGRLQWAINAEQFEILHDIKIDAANTVYCAGAVSKGIFTKFEDFIHFFPNSGRRRVLTERPIDTNFDGVQIDEDCPFFSKKTICLGKDTFQRVYVAQDAEHNKLFIWRLSSNGQIDSTFNQVSVTLPANQSNKTPVYLSFSSNRGTLNHTTGSITFNLEGNVLEGNGFIHKMPIITNKFLIINKNNTNVGVIENGRYIKNSGSEYGVYKLENNTAITRFSDQFIVASSVKRTLGGANSTFVFPSFSPKIHGFRFANTNFPGVFMELFSGSHSDEAIRAGVSGTWSLCGGMAQAAADFHYHKMEISDVLNPPTAGSDLMEYIIKRQVDSFKAGVKKDDFFWNLGTIFQTTTDLLRLLIFGDTPSEDTFLRILRSKYPTGATFYAFWDFEEGRNRFKDWRKLVSYNEWPKIKAVIDKFGYAQIGLNYALRSEGGDISDNHQVIATGYQIDNKDNLKELYIYDPNFPGVEDLKIKVVNVDHYTSGIVGREIFEELFGYTFEQLSSGSSFRKPVHGLFLIPLKPEKPVF
jgi:matrix metalloproteinase-14 (membrane-inserted)